MKRLLIALVLLCTLAPAAPALAADDAKERIVLVGSVLVDRDETAGDVVVVDGDVLVRGTVDGDLVVVDGDVTIRGTVTGDVVTLAGTATLGRRARISGDLVYFDKEPVVADGARVAGDRKKFDGEFKGVGTAVAIGFWVAVGLSMFVLGLLLLLLAPRAGDAVAATAKARWGISIPVGIAAIILLPIIAVLACVSIIGLPLGIVLGLLLVPLAAIAYVTTAFVVGRLVIKGARIPAFVVGLLIMRALAIIPFAGGLIGLLAVIFGLGVLFVTLFRSRS